MKAQNLAPTPEPTIRKATLPHNAYHSKYNTIAHEILDDEAAIGGVTPEMFDLLDNVIDWTRAELPPRTAEQYAMLGHDDAVVVLKTIDRVLYTHGFIYPSVPMGWVALLSDGLTPRTLNVTELASLADTGAFNDRRLSDIARIGSGPFYIVDCDTASFLYLAVADVLHLPISMTNLPSHDFVQWVLADGKHIDFETMYGIERSDLDYAHFGQTSTSVAKHFFMFPWSREQVLSYHTILVAGDWSDLGSRKRERDLARYAIALFPTWIDAWNELAWSLVMDDDPTVRRNTATLDAAKRGVDGFEFANNLDTLACAYAEAGRFDLALITEQKATKAFNDFPDATNFGDFVKDFKAHRTCYDVRVPVPKTNVHV